MKVKIFSSGDFSGGKALQDNVNDWLKQADDNNLVILDQQAVGKGSGSGTLHIVIFYRGNHPAEAPQDAPS